MTRAVSKRARRSKSLDVEKIDDGRISFLLALEDRAFAEDGSELIHSLEIEGELSLPTLQILAIEPRAIFQPHAECAMSLQAVRDMVGLRVGPGFRSRVLEVMGGVKGCSHFLTLALDLAAAHTLSIFLRIGEQVDYEGRHLPDSRWMPVALEIEPRLENACIALQTSTRLMQDALAKAKRDSERDRGEPR